jgi:hypothetical protein
MQLSKALGVTCEAFATCDDVTGEPQPEPKKPAWKEKT